MHAGNLIWFFLSTRNFFFAPLFSLKLNFNFPSLARLHICAAIRRLPDCSLDLWNENKTFGIEPCSSETFHSKMILKSTRNLSNWNAIFSSTRSSALEFCGLPETLECGLCYHLGTAIRWDLWQRRWSIGNRRFFPFARRIRIGICRTNRARWLHCISLCNLRREFLSTLWPKIHRDSPQTNFKCSLFVNWVQRRETRYCNINWDSRFMFVIIAGVSSDSSSGFVNKFNILPLLLISFFKMLQLF